MDTQNTPIHVRLWHRSFWLLVVANLLLTMSTYMFIPVLPIWLHKNYGMSATDIAVVMGIYGIGLYLMGPFCSYLVQRYRRNKVCQLSLMVMLLCIVGMSLIFSGKWLVPVTLVSMSAIRLVMGVAYGLAQMVLCSTLIIDKCESFQRTEANHSAAWFGRFGLALGPMLALILLPRIGIFYTFICMAGLVAISIVLIQIVGFPFKAPEETARKISSDRFFLPKGILLLLNLLMVTTCVGMLLTLNHSAMFYALLMAGFFFALLAERFAFINADLESEIATGMVLLAISLVLLLTRRQVIVGYISPLFIGMGIGLVGSRFLLFFIKLSRHCQRGTAHSTYFLAWESGLAMGLFIGFYFFSTNVHQLMIASLILDVIALLFYHFVVYPWYITHKNR